MFAHLIAFLGCAFLLMFWLTVGRRQPRCFFFTAMGIAAIVLCARSDQRPETMLAILAGMGLLTVAILAGYHMLAARRRANHARFPIAGKRRRAA
jgi:hypothetical protein